MKTTLLFEGLLLRRRRIILFLLAVLVVTIGLLTPWRPPVASAHPLGNFTINRYTRIEPGIDQIHVRYVLDMAEIPTFQEMPRIDANRDGRVSDAEHMAYLADMTEELRHGMYLTVDDAGVSLHTVASELSFPPGQGGLPTLRLSLLLQGQRQIGNQPAEQNLYYRDDNYPQRLGWQEIVVR